MFHKVQVLAGIRLLEDQMLQLILEMEQVRWSRKIADRQLFKLRWKTNWRDQSNQLLYKNCDDDDFDGGDGGDDDENDGHCGALKHLKQKHQVCILPALSICIKYPILRFVKRYPCLLFF